MLSTRGFSQAEKDEDVDETASQRQRREKMHFRRQRCERPTRRFPDVWTVFRTCHTVHNVLTVFALDPLPRMYVYFLSLPYALQNPEPMHINPPKLLLDLARLQGPLFHPSEQPSPAHFNNRHPFYLHQRKTPWATYHIKHEVRADLIKSYKNEESVRHRLPSVIGCIE